MNHPDIITIYIYIPIPIHVSVKECVGIQTAALLVTHWISYGPHVPCQ